MKIYVKPKEGLIVQRNIDEFGRKVTILEGETVPNNLYYRRLISRGELIEIEAPTRKNKRRSG